MNHLLHPRHLLVILLAALILALLPAGISHAAAAEVDPRFRDYYDQHDGMRVLGIAHMPLEQANGYPAQLFEKGRIEDHRSDTINPDWAFMYGRLTDELMTSHPDVAVSASSSTYGDLAAAARLALRQSPPAGFNSGTMPVTGGVFVPYDGQLRRAPGYVVPDVFWNYINRDDLFLGGWLHDIGLPMTDVMQSQVSKQGSTRIITMQAFERTVLTYDPQNPAAWQVERANIGTDLALTRHPGQIGSGMPTPTPAVLQLVTGWTGTVSKTYADAATRYYFLRDTGGQYSIGANDRQMLQQLLDASWTGEQVQVWGTLHPAHAGEPAIQLTRLAILGNTTRQPRNLSPHASTHASSVLPADHTATYEPWKAIDGNLATAWVEGVAGPGIGETLTLDFPGMAQITHIGIAVGYDSDQETFAANNRVKRIALTFSSGYHIDQTFHDVQGRQEVTITPPEEWLAETDTLRIVIADVYPGTRYDDTPIAEVEVWGRVLEAGSTAQ